MKQWQRSSPTFSAFGVHQLLCSLTDSVLASNRENAVWNYIKSNCIIMVHENKCMNGWGIVQEKCEQLGFHCGVTYFNSQSCPTVNIILLICKSTNRKEAGLFGSTNNETETNTSYWKRSMTVLDNSLCPTSQFLSPWLDIIPGNQGSIKTRMRALPGCHLLSFFHPLIHPNLKNSAAL